MYHIVEFDDENVEIIHSNWIEKIDDDNRQMADVAFPPKNLYGSIRKYLRHKVFPSSTWTSYLDTDISTWTSKFCRQWVRL